MKRVMFCALAAAIVLAAPMRAAAETVKGTISDSMCAAKHSADKHAGKAEDHRKCVEKCTSGNGKFVLVTEGKVLQIANQDFKELKAHAAHEVTVTGDVKGDSITVAKIEMPAAKK
jgi:hypothetical protein